MIRLPVVAVLTVVGIFAGAELGRSSIAEIDPIYFSAPQSSRFFADLTAAGYRPDIDSEPDPQLFWAAERDLVDRSACGLCRRDLFARPTPLYPEARPLADATFREVASDPPPPPAAIDLDRYMSFPVTREDADRQRAPRAEQPAEAAVSFEHSQIDLGEPVGM
jgi:hypothetical protein